MLEQRPLTADDVRPEDLRAELARRRLPIYMLAARVRINPIRLGRLLNGRLTLTPALAERILRGLAEDGAR
jgi:hypothetical protein